LSAKRNGDAALQKNFRDGELRYICNALDTEMNFEQTAKAARGMPLSDVAIVTLQSDRDILP
jgi:hypothetical protein